MTVKEKVLTVYEDNHGLIAICADVPTAVDYLVSKNWIWENDIIVDDNGDEVTILAYFGEQWQEKLKSLENWKFNSFFSDWISLNWEPVYQN